MRPTLTWLTDHRFGLGWPCGSCPTSGRRQPSASSADEAPGQLGESHGLPTQRRPYQPGDPRMTWAVPTNVCLPTRASRPDTQRTNDGFPRPRGSCPQCPPGGAHRYATRSRTAQGTYHAAHARYAAISVCVLQSSPRLALLVYTCPASGPLVSRRSRRPRRRMRTHKVGYPRSRLISAMSCMTSSGAQPTNSMMGSIRTGDLTSSPAAYT